LGCSRTRPRVSRACERCRIKKAKCDGDKPCQRCNIDQALCSYKTRRRPESGSVTQRHTDLLLQHQSALTAGLLKLYSHVLTGQQWEGPPVEEFEGGPSVHCILERLGVIDNNDDDGTEQSLNAMNSYEALLPPMPSTKGVGLSVSLKKTARKEPSRAGPTTSGLNGNSPARPSISSTTTMTPPALARKRHKKNDNNDKPVMPAPLFHPQWTSPSSSSGSRSSFVETSSNSAGSRSSRWESPGFGDDLFPSQANTPISTCGSPDPSSMFQQQQQPQSRRLVNLQDGFFGDAIQATLHQVAFSSSDMGQEFYNEGYFIDATNGMNTFDYNDASRGAMGFGNMPVEFGV